MEVYKAINAVQKALSHTGIAKDRQTTGGATFKFRGIDDVYKAIAPLLAEHSLCIIPRCVARTFVERQSKSNGVLFYVTVEAEFDFVSAIDGSKHTARTFGEAMDSGDKATNKAMSAAYKYAAFQAFAIPTEGDNDADATTHDVAATLQESAALDHIAAIEGAGSKDALVKIYKAANAAAKAIGDTSALKRFEAAMLAQKPRFTETV